MKIFFISIALFSLGFLSAQTPFLDEDYHEKAIYYVNKDKDSTLFYIKKMEQSKNHCRLLFAKLMEARVFYNEGKYEQSVQLLDAILDEINIAPTPANYQSSKTLISKTYTGCTDLVKLNVYRRFYYLKRNEKKLSEAYEYLLLAEQIANKFPEKDTNYVKTKLSISYDLASLKTTLRQHKESLIILTKIEDELEDILVNQGKKTSGYLIEEQANINVLKGNNYMELAKENARLYDSAELFYKKAYEVTRKNEPSNDGYIGSHYLRMADVNSKNGNPQKALNFLKSHTKYREEKGGSAAIYILKSRCYSKLKKTDSAIYHAKMSLKHKINAPSKHFSLELYNILSENYFHEKKMDSAYKYSNLALQTTKEFNTDRENTSKRLKDKELSNMLALNKKIKENRKSTENQLNALIVGAIIAFIGFVIYTVFRKKKEQKKIALIKIEYQKLNASIVRPKNAESKPEISDSRIEQILKELEVIENSDLFLNKDFNLSSLAKLLNTNTSYLSRIINLNKKTSFNQYLMDLRINALLKTLEEKPIIRKYSVQALGESVGYKNGSSFTRAFKSNMGVSPSQYLKETYFDTR